MASISCLLNYDFQHTFFPRRTPLQHEAPYWPEHGSTGLGVSSPAPQDQSRVWLATENHRKKQKTEAEWSPSFIHLFNFIFFSFELLYFREACHILKWAPIVTVDVNCLWNLCFKLVIYVLVNQQVLRWVVCVWQNCLIKKIDDFMQYKQQGAVTHHVFFSPISSCELHTNHLCLFCPLHLWV